MKTSILIATSGRPVLFSNMLDSLRETTKGHDIETIAVIDNDEAALEIAKSWGVDIIDYGETMRGALACWNLALALSHGDILIPAGDDQKFYPNWLDYALESHKEKLGGYGVVGMNDLAFDGNIQLATMFLFDRKFCKEALGGVIAPPVYNYYCIDSEVNARAKSMGKFYWENRSIIEHLHSAWGKRPLDAHDIQRGEKGFMTIDNKIFDERKSLGFPITWESVI